MKFFRLPAFTVAVAACLLLGATPNEAKAFRPASFVPKKSLVETVDKLTQSPALIRRGGGKKQQVAVEEVVKPSGQVTFSYWLDVACTVALSIFMILWWRSIDEAGATPPSYPYFAKSVLDNGFCNKDFGKAGKEFLTQKICCYVDFIMVGISYVLAKAQGKDKNLIFVASAIYTLVHGIVHLSVYINPAVSSGPVDTLALAILAVVLIFCPLGLYTVLGTAPSTKDTNLKLPVSALAWAACVWLYGQVFKMKEYALTYINVTTFLLFFGSRCLLIGTKTPEEIEAREQLNDMFPSFWVGSLATIFVMFIMCSEPLACSGWFGEAGGHVLFEIALYSYLLSTTFP